jgi:hypothetical protein
MAKAYYALVAGLPDLLLDEGKVQYTLREFRDDLREMLSAGHFLQIQALFYSYDNRNLLALLEQGSEVVLDPLGNFSREELEEEIRSPGLLPSYMGVFIEEYRGGVRAPDGLGYADRLTSLMYSRLLDPDTGLPEGFVRKWLVFDRELRNVVTALACRALDRPVAGVLVGDVYVVESILRANSGDFGLGRELPWLERLLHLYAGSDLLARERGIDEIRWEQAEQLTTFEYFTVHKAAAYVVLLGIAERWMALDETVGREMFNRIMQDLQSGFAFPAEFSIRGGRKHANNG